MGRPSTLLPYEPSLLSHRIGLAQTAVLGMTDPHRHGEILVCATAIPLEKGRQAHIPLWAPVMVNAGIFSERVGRPARAEVDAFGPVMTVRRPYGGFQMG